MKVNESPFNVGFGEAPLHFAERSEEESLIVSAFQAENPSNRTFKISGPRRLGNQPKNNLKKLALLLTHCQIDLL